MISFDFFPLYRPLAFLDGADIVFPHRCSTGSEAKSKLPVDNPPSWLPSRNSQFKVGILLGGGDPLGTVGADTEPSQRTQQGRRVPQTLKNQWSLVPRLVGNSGWWCCLLEAWPQALELPGLRASKMTPVPKWTYHLSQVDQRPEGPLS